MYKYKNNLLPTIFSSLYTENRAFHNYPTRQSTALRIPLTHTKLAASFIKKTGVSLWNTYSPQISIDTKIGLFKQKITQILVDKY
jgi:hypothetical protein